MKGWLSWRILINRDVFMESMIVLLGPSKGWNQDTRKDWEKLGSLYSVILASLLLLLSSISLRFFCFFFHHYLWNSEFSQDYEIFQLQLQIAGTLSLAIVESYTHSPLNQLTVAWPWSYILWVGYSLMNMGVRQWTWRKAVCIDDPKMLTREFVNLSVML